MIVNTIIVQKTDGDPLEWSFKEKSKEGTKPMTFIQAKGVEAKLSVPDKEQFTVSSDTFKTPNNDIITSKKFEIPGDYYLKVDDRYMNLGIDTVKSARKGSSVIASDVIMILHPHNYDMYRYDMSKDIKIRRIINTMTLNGFVAEVPKNLGWEIHLLIRRRDIHESEPEWMDLEISKKKNAAAGVFLRTEYQHQVDLMLTRFKNRSVSKKDMKLDDIDTSSTEISKEIRPWRYIRYLDHPPTKFIIYRKSARTKRKLTRMIKNNAHFHNGIRYELVEYESLSPTEPMKCNSATLYGIWFSPVDTSLSQFRYLFIMSKSGRTVPIRES